MREHETMQVEGWAGMGELRAVLGNQQTERTGRRESTTRGAWARTLWRGAPTASAAPRGWGSQRR